MKLMDKYTTEAGGAGDWGTDKARARLQKDTPGQKIKRKGKMKTFRDLLESVELEEKMKDKPYEKQIGMGDSRSEKEIRDQISGLSDGTLKKWASKPAGRFGSKIAKLQDKVVAAEMKKRGLKESVEEAYKDDDDYRKG